ncbi:MAG TPA: GDP-L-fucose synthase [Bdellovibrionales bacterium]|mgnify:CR=1 FL=1|nr:GDP-L-fucose synthase [Bdellovibrionales bacterium]
MGTINLKGKKILVTGGHGLVGSALLKTLPADVVAPRRAECDFIDASATDLLFSRVKPDYVFHLAAKVGGIKANMADPVGFYEVNNRITMNVFAAAHKAGVKKVAQLSSSCIYPRACAQPIREEHLLSGPLEPTNENYALAKIGAMRLGHAYHMQLGMHVVCPVAAGVYGAGDSFDLDKSHVMSALVRRFIEARDANAPSVTLWGSGSPRRQFIHVDDVARALVYFMENVDTPEHVNIGPDDDISIRELAELIATLVGYKGRIDWDRSKPDGMPRKWMAVDRSKALGFLTNIPLRQGILDVIADFGRWRANQG